MAELNKIRFDAREYYADLPRTGEREDLKLLHIAEDNGLRSPIYCYRAMSFQIVIEDMADPFPEMPYLDKSCIDVREEPWIKLYDNDSPENRRDAAWLFTHAMISQKLGRALDRELRQDLGEKSEVFSGEIKPEPFVFQRWMCAYLKRAFGRLSG